MTTTRYTLRQAAKVAGMRPAYLGDMIRAGDVPGVWYVPPSPGVSRGRYVIFRARFDAWIGIADAPEPETLPTRNPFIRDVSRKSA